MTVSRDSADIASLVSGALKGDPGVTVTGVASLAEAGPAEVSFLGSAKYRDLVLPSRAGIVLVPPDFDAPPPKGRAWVVCEDPSSAFSEVIAIFAPPPVSYPPGIHPTSVVHPEARVDESAHVGPQAVVESGVRIGARSVVAAGCYVGEDTTIGDDCLVYPNVTIRERCRLGDRVIVHSGTVIGSDGFGYESGPAGHRKVPQVGTVRIDDDVELGAQVAVDRARFGQTWIKQGTKIDNLVQIAHNVVIGEYCLVVGQAGISGSSRLGRGAILAGQAGIAGHLAIGDGAIVMAQAGVTKDIADGAAVIGSPAVDRREFAKSQSSLKRLNSALTRLRELEKVVAELKDALAAKDR